MCASGGRGLRGRIMTVILLYMETTHLVAPSTELVPVTDDRHVISTVEVAQKSRVALERAYADDLPRLVAGWLLAQRSENTRKAYARGFMKWEKFCRGIGVHPIAAGRVEADAYARYLEAAGTPNTSSAHAMSTASSFYKYAISVDATDRNPFEAAKRPKVDVDHSATEGLTEEETAKLLEAAYKLSKRAYALTLLLYTLGLR